MKKINELRKQLGHEMDLANAHFVEMLEAKKRAADLADKIAAIYEEEIKKPRIPITDCEFGG